MMHALLTTLTWQRNQLNQQRLELERDLVQLEHHIQTFLHAIANSKSTTALILPEQEMARSHFIAKQQQLQNDCITKKKAIQSHQATVSAQLIEVNTQLKRFEKHQTRKKNLKQYQELTTQQKNSDEWAIQRGAKQ